MAAPARWYYEIGDGEAAAALIEVQHTSSTGRSVLLHGGVILSGDPNVGDFAAGDVLIDGKRIAAVGADLTAQARAQDAVVIDLRGMILLPGLVDGHRHCWQNQFRRVIPDADIARYMGFAHGALALHYRPHDVYVGNLISMLGLMSGGVTTVLDFSHNSRTPSHSDAAFAAYADAGTRVVHAFATPNTGEWDRQWPDDVTRLRDTFCSTSDSRVSVRLGMYSPQRADYARLLRFARDTGLPITIDGVVGARQAARVVALARAGLLGPDVGLVHCTDMSPEGWSLIAESGATVTLATTSDQQVGLADGRPPIQQALDHGIRPGLSTDVEVALSGSMFTEMRATLALQRMDVYAARYAGSSAPDLLTNRDVLEFATMGGARAIGLEASIGSLTPGKAADIIGLRGEDIETLPQNGAAGTVVQVGDPGLVDLVLVDGVPRKWRGQLVGQDVDAVRRLAYESRDHLAAALSLHIDPVRVRDHDLGIGVSTLTGFVDEIATADSPAG